jgi:hypothetical protein
MGTNNTPSSHHLMFNIFSSTTAIPSFHLLPGGLPFCLDLLSVAFLVGCWWLVINGGLCWLLLDFGCWILDLLDCVDRVWA